MQYGNEKRWGEVWADKEGLNRTMQYGNLNKNNKNNIKNMFKSYYVVWKHKIINIAKTKYKQFKSYYVVWKLAMIFLITTLPLSFKSYYVVWKPDSLAVEVIERYGLNRTMQYGNFLRRK